ncbi:hypothetical protein B0O99DRAFT_607008 [Bisporella sp. PMI_857]|nr:hypothetical protein B0O99DRAFT_607008 [Bisporella sp. PMI_857]
MWSQGQSNYTQQSAQLGRRQLITQVTRGLDNHPPPQATQAIRRLLDQLPPQAIQITLRPQNHLLTRAIQATRRTLNQLHPQVTQITLRPPNHLLTRAIQATRRTLNQLRPQVIQITLRPQNHLLTRAIQATRRTLNQLHPQVIQITLRPQSHLLTQATQATQRILSHITPQVTRATQGLRNQFLHQAIRTRLNHLLPAEAQFRAIQCILAIFLTVGRRQQCIPPIFIQSHTVIQPKLHVTLETLLQRQFHSTPQYAQLGSTQLLTQVIQSLPNQSLSSRFFHFHPCLSLLRLLNPALQILEISSSILPARP